MAKYRLVMIDVGFQKSKIRHHVENNEMIFLPFFIFNIVVNKKKKVLLAILWNN